MWNKLAGCARRLLSDPDDVEDVIQEVFLKLWCIREKLEEYDSVEAVAMQITRHLCLNHLKAFQFSRREHLSEQFGLSETTMPDVQLEEKDSLDRVMRIIDQLPGLQQLVLRMKHVEGREVEEIASLTGSSPEAVRMNLSRARRRVKELFFKM